MNYNKIEILKKLLSRSCSENDLKDLFSWYNSEKGQDEINRELDSRWQSFEEKEDVYIDSKRIFDKIREGIQKQRTRSINRNLKRILPYAAVLLFFIGVAGILFYQGQGSKFRFNKNRTLYTSVLVENGQRSKIILPDSSVVWVNSGTKVSYNNDFVQSRDIYLSGEAFFQVARNEKVPLLVHCNDLIVKVLGTKFNVNAYPENQKIDVVLESGSVQLLNDQDRNFNYKLKPGEEADVNLTKRSVAIGIADIKKSTSWREGFLIFKNDPMKLVIDKLERWYNIKITVENPEVFNSVFTATISNEGFEQIFRLMEFSCPVRYKVLPSNVPGTVPQVVISKK